MNLIDKLKQVHPYYEDAAERCQYLSKSYLGGEAYRQGEFLTKYYGEDQSGMGNLYLKRLNATPLHNYVKTTVDIYRSFLFRELPHREQGALLDNPLFQQWMLDTDNDGQNIDSFMKTINDKAMVESGVWICVDKPAYAVETVAQEQALGIRGYCSVYTLSNVLDWNFERTISGKRELEYIKVVESNNTEYCKVSVWTKDVIIKYTVAKDETGEWDQVVAQEEYANPLGIIPFVFYTAGERIKPGVGTSIVEDVADIQRYIYNLLSEAEQSIRIAGHPTLVKTAETSATAGAGAIINLPHDQDPGLNPYLLQPTGATITTILDTIDKQVEAIKSMTHTSAVTATKGSPMSGVALQTERQLLNAKLSDISDNLQELEYKLHKLWAMWHNIELPQDFYIEYATSFDMRDSHAEAELYRKLLEINPHKEFARYIHKETVDLVVEDADEARETKDSIDAEMDAEPTIPPMPEA